ncbi:MAG: ATP-binding protein [Acinetobacter sp.]|nr:ATP-binding protein [Acinetobacter sp.]MBP6352798.1 ATP-binding protein [Acinetobacter sp.]MBP7217694.1 ATP-binding protein [Acinetobacter sp.]
MMKKTFAAVLLCSSFALGSSAMAGGLEDDMEVLGKNYKAFNQAKTAQAATTALNNMRTAAVHSKQYKLAPQSTAKTPSSSALFEQIIVEIDKAKLLVQAGKLDAAKQQAKKIAELREQGHKHYMH